MAYNIAAALDEKLAGRLTSTLDQFTDVVQELKSYKMESSESALKELVEEFSRNLTSGTNDQMQRIGEVLTDVAQTLESTALRSTSNQTELEKSFAGHMEAMSQTVSDLMERLGTNQQALKAQNHNRIVELLDHVKEKMAEQQQELAAISTSSQGKLDANLQVISEKMAGLLAQVTDRAEGVSKTLDDRIADLTDRFAVSLNDASSRYEQERGALNSLLQRIETTLSTMGTLSAGIAEAGASFRNTAGPVSEATNSLVRGVTSLRQAQDTFVSEANDAQEKSQAMAERTDKTLEYVQGALAETKESWEAYASNFEGLRDNLNEVFKVLNTGLREYSTIVDENLNKYLASLDSNLAESSALLSGAIVELQDAVGDLADNRNNRR